MYLQNEQGFGIVELIVSTIIVVGLSMGIFGFYNQMSSFASQGTSKLDLQQEASVILEEIANHIREGGDIAGVGIDIWSYYGAEDWYQQNSGNWLRVDKKLLYDLGKVPQRYVRIWGEQYNNYGAKEIWKSRGGVGEYFNNMELLLGDHDIGGYRAEVDNITFTDFWNAGNGPNQVRVNLTLKVTDLQDPGGAQNTMTFTTQVEPRNRKK